MTIEVDVKGASTNTHFTLDDGVDIGVAGELTLISMRHPETNQPVEFTVYAPGQWKEVSAVWHDERDAI